MLVALRDEVFVWAFHTAEKYVYGAPVGRALDWIIGQMVIGAGFTDYSADRHDVA
jgi:hypothetical protein